MSCPTTVVESLTAATFKPVRGEVWFDDGSIILEAENTQYRVHSTVLSLRSSVFHRTFSSAKMSNLEGCPVVPFDDTAEDMKLLLHAIYHHPNAGDPTEPPQPMSFPELSSLLRLGSKYELVDLRDNAVSRLKAEYPSRFGDLARKTKEFAFILEHPGIYFEMVPLITEVGLHSLLPSALYTIISFFDFNAIFHGVEHTDGTMVQLSADIQRTCLIAHERLLKMMPLVMCGWLYEDPVQESCAYVMGCCEVFRLMREGSWKILRDPYYALTDWEDTFSFLNVDDMELCEDCEMAAKYSHEKGRKQIWNELPSIFGLGSWEEVKAKDCI